MPTRTRSALAMVLTLAAPAAVVGAACAGSEGQDTTEASAQELVPLPRCRVTRIFRDVPVLAPRPRICERPTRVGPIKCPPQIELQEVDVFCRNSCTRAAISCIWVDVYGVEHAIEELRRDPDVEYSIPCNHFDGCGGQIPPPTL